MRITKIIIYNLTVLLLLFLLAEAGFRIWAPDYQFYERTSLAGFTEEAQLKLDTNWVQQDSLLGWVCRKNPHLKFYRSDFWEVNYGINDLGFRSTEFPREKFASEPKTRILLLGDSFLFGIFLEESTTISSRMQFYLGENYEVYNMAIPGWGIDQMYQAYDAYSQLIQPDIVFLFFIDDNISRVMEAFYWGAATKRAYRADKNELMFREPEHGQLSELEGYFCFNSQIINRLYRIGVLQQAQPLTEVILENWINQENVVERNLKAVRFPRREQIGHPELKRYDLQDFFRRNSIFYLDLEPEMQLFSTEKTTSLYIEKDDHPSAVGADYIASKLVQIILNSR